MSRKLVKVSPEELKKQARKEKMERTGDAIKKARYVLYMIIIPVISYFIMEFMIRNPFAKMKLNIQFLNIAFWELLMLVLFFVFGSFRVAARIELISAYLIGLLDYFVISFRGTPVQPWDIYSIRVAASVAGGYSYKVKGSIVFLGILTIALCVGVHFIKLKIDRKNRMKLIISLCALIISLASMYGYIKYVQAESTVKKYSIYDKLFTPTTMTYKDGTMLAFLMECKYLKVDKPQGYSDKKAKAILDKVEVQGKKNTGVKPNIIVIMDEAFADLSILQEYNTNVDEMPFVRSMLNGADNTISGYLDVSVLGGNTANTEFEFLTGDSMAWLPQGAVPYQQYIKENRESMASVLKEQGYSTVAIHPYKATGWERDKVYNYFGFDEFYAKEAFKDAEIVRKYVSDRADLAKVTELLNSKEEGKPLFVFNVTMQNHSAYTDAYDNFVEDVQVDGVKKLATNQYLSLIKCSDQAIEEFIDGLEDYNEPTVVVFFGDHQPTDSVVNPLYKLNGNNVASLSIDELRKRYKVPFFIWANYDIDEESGLAMSPNFLGAKTMDVAGVQMSTYENYLLELSEKCSSINTLGVTDVNGDIKSIEEVKDEYYDYRLLQYYMLFR